MVEIAERVDRLERAIMELVYVQHRTEMEIQSLKDEMKEFKNEMEEFKDWAKKTIEENHEWSKREVRRMNKQWGELANKMGTIVEDIVFPAVRPVVKKYFGCNPSILMMNVEKRMDDINAEFDVIAICDDLAFVVEVKSTARVEYIKQAKNKVELFKELFPEYGNRKIVPILASLRIKEDILNKLTKEKIYGMAYREWEYMDILNFDVLKNG